MNVPLFSTIKSFVSDLNDTYGTKHHSLKLYNHLLNKTHIDDDEAVDKHIEIFKKFIVENRDGIISRNEKGIVKQKVIFSEKVYINIRNLINISDKETKDIIWKHLLVLSAYLDPAGGAKEVLKKQKDEKIKKDILPEGPTGDFLNSMIGTLQDSVDVDNAQTPMDVFNQIMKSGAFNQVLNMVNTSMSSGQLDIGQLLGMAQGMMGQISKGGEGGESVLGSEGGLGGLESMFSQFGIDKEQIEKIATDIKKGVEETTDVKKVVEETSVEETTDVKKVVEE